MVSNPRLLPFPIASTTGELADANQIILDTTNFDGNLDENTTNAQLLAQAVDDLTAAGLPQDQTDWLNETSEVTGSSVAVTNIAASVTDVLIWVRSAIVTDAIAGNSGVGVVIAEANRQSDGTFDRQSGTNVLDTDVANAYVYVGITTSDYDALTLSGTYLEARRGTDLVFSSSLADLTRPTQLSDSQFRYVRTDNDEYNYVAGDVLTVVTRVTTATTTYTYNPTGDFTGNIDDLPLTSTDGDFQARVTGTSENQQLTDVERSKVAGLVATTSDQTGQTLTVAYKNGGLSGKATDYSLTWDAANPVLASFTEQRIVSILVDANQVPTAIAGGGDIGDPLVIGDKRAYQVTLPVEAGGGTATTHTVTGTITTVTGASLNSEYKIDRDNLTTELQNEIDNTNPSGNVDAARLTAVESKVAALFPLTPDVSDLVDWGDIYDPLRPVTEVQEAAGYSLFADYRGDATRYQSTGVTYDNTGTDVVRYTGLGSSLFRSFGFKVDGPADEVLMWLVDGSELIPYIDMTAAGTFRINNYTIAHTSGTPVSNRFRFVDRTTGSQFVSAGSGNSGYTIPDIPTGATDVTRTAEFNIEVYVNGVDTGAGGIISFAIPVPDAEQDRQQISHNFNLGPLHGNRQVAVTFEYRFVITTTPEFRVIMTIDAAPSDVTIDFQRLELLESYTPADTVTRTDNFTVFQDAGGDYTFTGENELLLGFAPLNTSGTMEAVPVVINSSGTVTELNDRTTPIPDAGFDEVEIQDQTGLAGFEFRTFVSDHFLSHSDLAHLIPDRTTQWAYGLARAVTVSTINAVTEPVDFAAGTTIDGSPIATGGQIESVYEATGTGTSSGELVASVVLPADYTDFDYCHVTEYDVTNLQWRHAAFKVSILALADTNDNIRLQGNTVLQWTLATRTLAMNPSAQEIFSVELVKI